MLKIDIHTHILPENLPDYARKFGYDGFVKLDHHAPCCARMLVGDKGFREIKSDCWDPVVRLHDCDRHGVHVQVLSTVPILFYYWARSHDALETSRFLNDHMAQVVQAYPKRFVGLGTVPLQDPQLAIQELERCMKELGMAGVQIGSHVNDWNLSAPELFPFFQAAADLGAAVFVHPWDMMGKDRMNRYWLPWLVGMPAESTLAICSVIFGGVLERLPHLRLAFAHGGGSFPFTLGRIAHGHAVRPDLVAIDNPVDPRHYVGKFWVDSLVHDPEALRFLVKTMGEDRIALGTDYPFPLGEWLGDWQPGKLIESMDDFSPALKQKLLADNALSWLGRPASHFIH